MHDPAPELWRCEALVTSASDVLDDALALVGELAPADVAAGEWLAHLLHTELPVVRSALPVTTSPRELALHELGAIEAALETALETRGWAFPRTDEDPPVLTDRLDPPA